MTKLQQLEQLQEAKKMWSQSERILRILRTESSKPLKKLTDSEILLWHQKNMK